MPNAFRIKNRTAGVAAWLAIASSGENKEAQAGWKDAINRGDKVWLEDFVKAYGVLKSIIENVQSPRAEKFLMEWMVGTIESEYFSKLRAASGSPEKPLPPVERLIPGEIARSIEARFPGVAGDMRHKGRDLVSNIRKIQIATAKCPGRQEWTPVEYVSFPFKIEGE